MYLKSGIIASALFIDICKAFDMVNNEILLVKLENFRLKGFLYELLRSFLIKR